MIPYAHNSLSFEKKFTLLVWKRYSGVLDYMACGTYMCYI